MDVAVSTAETAVRPLTAEQLYRPTAGDPCVRAAAAIALAAKEELVIIDTDGCNTDDPDIRKLASDTGLIVSRIAAARIGLTDTPSLTFRQIQERLIVMTRGALADGAALAIATARRVPVLVVEPEEMLANETLPRPTAVH